MLHLPAAENSKEDRARLNQDANIPEDQRDDSAESPEILADMVCHYEAVK